MTINLGLVQSVQLDRVNLTMTTRSWMHTRGRGGDQVDVQTFTTLPALLAAYDALVAAEENFGDHPDPPEEG